MLPDRPGLRFCHEGPAALLYLIVAIVFVVVAASLSRHRGLRFGGVCAMLGYVALLRGINVGGHRVKMAHLRQLFEELGFEDVATFIASGNVIFSASSRDASALEDEIERHLAQRLGYEVATFIRSPAELEAVAAFEPCGRGNGGPSASSLYVIFLSAPADDDLRSRFRGASSDMDDFECSGREVYWLIRGKLTDSRVFDGGLQKTTGTVPTTMRNMNTVRRLVAKLNSQRRG